MILASPRAAGSSRALLAVVAVLHGLSPLLVMGPNYWFGVDETVYLSQVNAFVPPGFFSAPRARGVTFLAAPVTMLTDSTSAVRVWMAILSALALYLAFRPWLRLHDGVTVPLAALLYSTIWVVIYYAYQVMPDYWDAAAVLAATGCALRFAREGRRWQLFAVAVSMALAALIRPSDALYGGAALAVCALFVRTGWRRRSGVLAAVAAGCLIGAADWIVEAFVRYGGLLQRIHQAQAENGGPGLHFAGLDQWRTLAGPLLCRNGCHASAPLLYQWWWLALAALVAAGIWFARRDGAQALAPILVPTVVGLAMAAQYVVAVTYAAPRFLTPGYALLVLPAAYGAVGLVRSARAGVPRFALAGGLVAVLALNTAIQLHVITADIEPGMRRSDAGLLADAGYLTGAGLRGPCVVRAADGGDAARLAYATECSDAPTARAALRDRLEDGARVVWLGDRAPSRYYDTRWRQLRLPSSTGTLPKRAWLSVPGPAGSGGDVRG